MRYTGAPDAAKLWNTKPDMGAVIFCDTDEYEIFCVLYKAGERYPMYNRENIHRVMAREPNKGYKITTPDIRKKMIELRID